MLIPRLISEGARVQRGFVRWPDGRKAKITMGRGYAYFRAHGKRVSVARFLCWLHHGPPPTTTQRWVADHKNQRTEDNRPSNLRWATVQQNAWNCLGRGSFAYRIRRGALDPQKAVNYGTRMRAKRMARGLSLREVARRLDANPQYLSDLERGKRVFNALIEPRYLAAISQ